MPAIVPRLATRSLPEVLERTPFTLVRLDRARSFHEGFADFLDLSFPALFTFGTLDRLDTDPNTLNALFQTAAGALRRGVTDGYYLFGAGKVIGQHSGQDRPPEFGDATSPEEEEYRARVAATLGRRPPEVIERVRHLAMYFVPIVERKQQAGGASWNDPFLGRTGSTPPPAARTVSPATHGAYGVLGIPSSSTDDEVKAAYKAQLMLHHPDRVVHLSAPLQQTARQQVLAAKAAFDSIRKLRGF